MAGGVGEVIFVRRHVILDDQHGAAGIFVVLHRFDGILSVGESDAVSVGNDRVRNVHPAQRQQIVEGAALLIDVDSSIFLRQIGFAGLHGPGDSVLPVDRVISVADHIFLNIALSDHTDDIVNAVSHKADDSVGFLRTIPFVNIAVVPVQQGNLELAAVLCSLHDLVYRVGAFQRHMGVSAEQGVVVGVGGHQLVAGADAARICKDEVLAREGHAFGGAGICHDAPVFFQVVRADLDPIFPAVKLGVDGDDVGVGVGVVHRFRLKAHGRSVVFGVLHVPVQRDLVDLVVICGKLIGIAAADGLEIKLVVDQLVGDRLFAVVFRFIHAFARRNRPWIGIAVDVGVIGQVGDGVHPLRRVQIIGQVKAADVLGIIDIVVSVIQSPFIHVKMAGGVLEGRRFVGPGAAADSLGIRIYLIGGIYGGCHGVRHCVASVRLYKFIIGFL